jgi:glyoxylase-like metal-dependent hydrolase (beta-lactamase superfamily II)
MGEFEYITEGIYQVGGPDLSDSADASVYVIACASELIMIDSGAGREPDLIIENTKEAGLSPEKITTVILTHCHVDHIGGVEFFRKKYGCSILAHALDADAIESGDPTLTASSWYKIQLPTTRVHRHLIGEHETISIGGDEIHCIHTPGHTPGSISVYLDRGGIRTLFGQDIHGPFSWEFGSDLEQWRTSMQSLLDLNADILCEGHFGIYKSKERVAKYIRSYLDRYAER